jgi:hypothetical protein
LYPAGKALTSGRVHGSIEIFILLHGKIQIAQLCDLNFDGNNLSSLMTNPAISKNEFHFHLVGI